MNTETMIMELNNVIEKHKNDFVPAFQVNIVSMCRDIIPKLEKLAEYETIGTVEECLEAAERQRKKKVNGRYKTTYIWDAGYCPSCNCGITARWNYCQNCGNAIDWVEP